MGGTGQREKTSSGCSRTPTVLDGKLASQQSSALVALRLKSLTFASVLIGQGVDWSVSLRKDDLRKV